MRWRASAATQRPATARTCASALGMRLSSAAARLDSAPPPIPACACWKSAAWAGDASVTVCVLGESFVPAAWSGWRRFAAASADWPFSHTRDRALIARTFSMSTLSLRAVCDRVNWCAIAVTVPASFFDTMSSNHSAGLTFGARCCRRPSGSAWKCSTASRPGPK